MTQDQLRKALEKLAADGWTQPQIADAADVSQSTVSRVLAGSGCRVPTYLRLIEFVSSQESSAA